MGMKREFEKRMPIMLRIIRKRYRAANGDTSAFTEEARQNALCWAWHYWISWSKTSNLPLNERAAAAATYGCKEKRVFGSEGVRGRRDAMDAIKPVRVLDRGYISRQDLALLHDTEYRSEGFVFEQMPQHLLIFARPIANGYSHKEIADAMGVKVGKVDRISVELTNWLLARKDNPIDAPKGLEVFETVSVKPSGIRPRSTYPEMPPMLINPSLTKQELLARLQFARDGEETRNSLKAIGTNAKLAYCRKHDAVVMA